VLKLDEVKDRLMRAQVDEMRGLQAEGKVWLSLQKMIDIAPLVDKSA
jgi:hypothetical protein